MAEPLAIRVTKDTFPFVVAAPTVPRSIETAYYSIQPWPATMRALRAAWNALPRPERRACYKQIGPQSLAETARILRESTVACAAFIARENARLDAEEGHD